MRPKSSGLSRAEIASRRNRDRTGFAKREGKTAKHPLD
jgi:hypothetical protein